MYLYTQDNSLWTVRSTDCNLILVMEVVVDLYQLYKTRSGMKLQQTGDFLTGCENGMEGGGG